MEQSMPEHSRDARTPIVECKGPPHSGTGIEYLGQLAITTPTDSKQSQQSNGYQQAALTMEFPSHNCDQTKFCWGLERKSKQSRTQRNIQES